MKTKLLLACLTVFTIATSVALAGPHGGFGGGFANSGSFHSGGNWNGGNWNGHCHGGGSSFVFIGGFPFFGYPFGYGYGYPYGYGYGYPYGYGYGGYYGYGSGYYGYGSGYYGNGYYNNGYYGNRYSYGSSHGYTNGSVVRLQRQLARAGYYHGPIDGIMGSRTQHALRAYQHDHGTASL